MTLLQITSWISVISTRIELATKLFVSMWSLRRMKTSADCWSSSHIISISPPVSCTPGDVPGGGRLEFWIHVQLGGLRILHVLFHLIILFPFLLDCNYESNEGKWTILTRDMKPMMADIVRSTIFYSKITEAFVHDIWNSCWPTCITLEIYG